MPRPRKFDTEDTVIAIRDAFWRGGYSGTSMTDLVDATGVKAGSLHAAFGTKDELFAIAFASYSDHFLRCMDTGANGFEAIERFVGGLLEAVIADHERKGCLIVQSATEVARHAPDNQRAINVRLEELHQFFVDRLADEAIEDPDLAAGLFGATISLLSLGRTSVEPEILRALVRSALRMMVADPSEKLLGGSA